MEFLNSAVGKNITFVKPAYFIISAFNGIANIRYYFVFLCFIYIFSVVGNTLVMIVIILDHTLRGPKHIGVVNFAFTDLLSSSALMTMTAWHSCFFCLTFFAAQAFNLVVLSFDRVMAITFPLHYQMRISHKLILSLIAFFWLLAITIILTAVGLLTRLSFCDSVVIQSFFCDHGPVYQLGCNDLTPNRVIAHLASVLVLWIPLAFIVGSYCCIGYSLSKTATCRERLKALQTCTGHLSLVAIYFLPALFIFTFGSIILPNARTVSLSLATVMSLTLNPIIYGLQTQEIKESLKKLLKVKMQFKISANK